MIRGRLLDRLEGLLDRSSEERQESKSRLLALPDYPRLLVLCHGNICRSPAAEQLLKRHLPSQRFEVSSAGLSHQENLSTPSDFVQEAKTFGLDLSTHRSRSASSLLVEWADLILIMDRSNRDLLFDFGPEGLKKSAWLGVWDPKGPIEIADPYGTTILFMRRTLERLARASESLARDLTGPKSA